MWIYPSPSTTYFIHKCQLTTCTLFIHHSCLLRECFPLSIPCTLHIDYECSGIVEISAPRTVKFVESAPEEVFRISDCMMTRLSRSFSSQKEPSACVCVHHSKTSSQDTRCSCKERIKRGKHCTIIQESRWVPEAMGAPHAQN